MAGRTTSKGREGEYKKARGELGERSAAHSYPILTHPTHTSNTPLRSHRTSPLQGWMPGGPRMWCEHCRTRLPPAVQLLPQSTRHAGGRRA